MPFTDAPETEATAPLEAPEANPVSEPTDQDTPTDAGAEQANPTADATNGSLNPEQPSTSSPAQPAAVGQPTRPQQAPDPAQQYKALLPEYTRSQQRVKAYEAEIERMRQAYRDIDPDAARKAIERERSQAEAVKLRPWHPKHPESGRTVQRIERFSTFKAAVDAIPDGPDKQATAQAIAQRLGVTVDDKKLFDEHAAYERDTQGELTRDPDAFVETRAERVFERMMAQYEQHQALRSETQQFLASNQEVIAKHKDEVLWAMNHPHRRDVGVELARLIEENEALKGKLGQQAETVEMAQAQRAAAGRRATVTRDTRTAAPQVDPVAKAQQLGIRGNSNDMARFLMRERARELEAR